VIKAGGRQLALWEGLTDYAAHAELMVLTACRIWRFAVEDPLLKGGRRPLGVRARPLAQRGRGSAASANARRRGGDRASRHPAGSRARAAGAEEPHATALNRRLVDRTLDWPGCRNVRELGGLPTRRGGETARRVLVRANSWSRLSLPACARWSATASARFSTFAKPLSLPAVRTRWRGPRACAISAFRRSRRASGCRCRSTLMRTRWWRRSGRCRGSCPRSSPNRPSRSFTVTGAGRTGLVSLVLLSLAALSARRSSRITSRASAGVRLRWALR
jgi:hypothetical protein